MPDSEQNALHLTTEQIEARVEWIEQAPADSGTLEGICVRPAPGERNELEQCRLSPEGGAEGDFWVDNCWKKLEDGSSDPSVQLTLMNSRAVDAVAGSRDRWKLAGDQLFVDFDLGDANLTAGDRLQIGSAVVEISPVPHTGCDLFRDRYGMDAVKFVNSKLGKALNLRGVLAQIVQEGVVSIGDTVTKL